MHSPQRLALWVFVALAAAMCGLVLAPFGAPIFWAAIIAYVTWPVFARLRRRLGGPPAFGAALMTFLVCTAILVPALWMAVALRGEILRMLDSAREYLAAGPLRLPDALRALPGGNELDAWLQAQTADSRALEGEMMRWTRARSHELAAFAGGLGRDLLQVAFCVLILFFLYREAETLLAQVRAVFRLALGDGVDRYLKTIGAMVRAVVFGVLLTAFAQGLVAGIGLRIIGVEPLVLLSALTIFAAFIPVVGTLAIFAPLTVTLLAAGRTWAAIFLALWAIVLVHPIDNLIRPLVVSSVTRMPFLLAAFGVVGGILAFGAKGIFIGPIALAIGLVLWQEAVAKAAAKPEAPPPASQQADRGS